MASFNKVAVVGAGAVGSFFGAMLARAGHAVVLVARPAHVQAIAREGLRLEMAGRVETIRLAASDDLAALQRAKLVRVRADRGTRASAIALTDRGDT
ncbi:MAG: 2-dehydropantoate 2-reductase N-terminal domain-containing protein, partial [Caldimonas sp.]